MFCLDNTDTIEGGCSVTAVVDCTIHGLVGSTFTNLYAGQLSDTDPSVLYTAAAAISVVSVTMVNTHNAAVTVNLYLDSANGGNPRRLIPEDVTLEVGYSLCFDGQRISIMSTSGGIVTSVNVSDTAYGAGWNAVTTVAPSKNAVYDEVELRAKAAAVITDNAVVTGDGGARGVQGTPIIVDSSGRMTNPSQPCFNVNPAVAQENIATGSSVTVIFGTERFDIGNNFASNTFTAPITGKHQLNIIIRLLEVDSAATYYRIGITTSNKNYYLNTITPNRFSGDISYWNLNGSVVADMDINDTAYVVMYQSGGAAQTDIHTFSTFSGALIC